MEPYKYSPEKAILTLDFLEHHLESHRKNLLYDLVTYGKTNIRLDTGFIHIKLSKGDL